MKARYIYGIGGTGRELAEMLIQRKENVAGFVLDKKYITPGIHNNLDIPIIAYEDLITQDISQFTITISLGYYLRN